ncbi:hypothetical protein [Nostoc sp. T09]|uniref:hypothetical protein n=1 Tax=Nostoc sp. T09 TaxID=1932621 RepID=UPI00117D45CE|nr:hypothetical protein [Nostoc sp. T09]
MDTLVSATSTGSLTGSQIEDLRLAASKMDGVERRGFQAYFAQSSIFITLGRLIRFFLCLE